MSVVEGAAIERMAIHRMEHVGIVVNDLPAAIEFFVEDIDAMVAAQQTRGAELVGELV